MGKKKSDRRPSRKQLNLDTKIKRFPVRLEELPLPDYWEISLPDRHICLLTDDGSTNTLKLAESLRDKGWKPIVVSFAQILEPSPLPEGINRVILEQLSEDYLKQQLTTTTNTYGPIAAFIHLHPLFEADSDRGISYLEADKAIVKQVFLMAKHLKPSLVAAADRGYSCFFTVARLDGAFGLEQKVNFNPISAGLFGLTKSLNREWKSVFCRAIDLSPYIAPQVSSEYILAELHDPNRCLSEVGYDLDRRTTLTASLTNLG